LAIEVWVITADELECGGAAPFHLTVHDPGRLAPQARRPAVTGLTSKRECRRTLVVPAPPPVKEIARPVRYRYGNRTMR